LDGRSNRQHNRNRHDDQRRRSVQLNLTLGEKSDGTFMPGILRLVMKGFVSGGKVCKGAAQQDHQSQASRREEFRGPERHGIVALVLQTARSRNQWRFQEQGRYLQTDCITPKCLKQIFDYEIGRNVFSL
jgi:hypothetical protein